MNILEIKHITKKFGEKTVLDDLCMVVPKNSILGFVGSNGAGKTTTMKMVLGLLPFDEGEIFVNGEKVTFGQNATNKNIGYLPDIPEFYGFMTPREYLAMCGEITGMSKTKIKEESQKLLSLVGLEKENKRISGFSRGMKQRLGIAQALLNSPKLLICDEPTSALDPIGRKEILDILSTVKGQTTVIFSTHILSDVERICDHIAFLYGGKIVLSGTLDEVRTLKKSDNIEIDFVNEDGASKFTQGWDCFEKLSNTKVVVFSKNKDEIIAIMDFLAKSKIPVLRIEKTESTLEDIFMEVMKK